MDPTTPLIRGPTQLYQRTRFAALLCRVDPLDGDLLRRFLLGQPGLRDQGNTDADD